MTISVTQLIITVSVAILAGLIMSRFMKLVQLPDVTGYLIAGVLIGCFCLGNLVLPNGLYFGFHDKGFADVKAFAIASEAALGFIAFSIGNEFRVTDLKKTGKQATVIAFAQALTATVLVDIALVVLHYILVAVTGTDILPVTAAIILGSIATATAPAATMMVVKQYRAKGSVTDILLPVVALDDAIGLVVFAISFGIAKALGGGVLSVTSVVVEPLLEIVLSLVLGAIMGLLLTFGEPFFHSRGNRMSLCVAIVLLAVGITSISDLSIGGVHIGFSALLTCMMMGTVFCNTSDYSKELMERADRWTKPLLIFFFVLSGAELDLSVFGQPVFVLVGAVYILVRSFGKYYGARYAAQATKCDPNIVKFLGLTLLPQAGVSLGMVNTVSADAEFGVTETAKMVRFIILFSILVYELVGPMLTKIALTKAGDIKSNEETNDRLRNDQQSEIAKK